MKKIFKAVKIMALALAIPGAGLAMEVAGGSGEEGKEVSWDDIARTVGKVSETAFRIARDRGAQARLQGQAGLICALTEALAIKYEASPVSNDLPEGVWGDKLPAALKKLVAPRIPRRYAYGAGGHLTEAKELSAAGMPPNHVLERLFRAKGELRGLTVRLEKSGAQRSAAHEEARRDAIESIGSVIGLIDEAAQEYRSRVQD